MTERQKQVYGAPTRPISLEPGDTVFKHVGPRVAEGDVRITAEQAREFQGIALLGTKIDRLSLDDISTSVWAKSYATGALSTYEGDYEVDETAVFSKSVEGPEPHYWRSVVNFVRYNEKHADTKIYNIFEVTALQGEVTSAIRRVRVIRNLTRVAFDEETGEPYDDNYSRQRRTFESPMEPEDIEAVRIRVSRLMSRQLVTSGR